MHPVSTAMTANDPLGVNSRIATESGDIGTIRYVGPVKVTGSIAAFDEHLKQDLWYGVEWDDAKRGKHNGTYEGVSYFHVKVPGSGSFVKVSKCRGKLRTGKTFLEAFLEKYCVGLSQESLNGRTARVAGSKRLLQAGKDEVDRMISFGGNSKIMVETVGFGKVEKKLQKLDSIKVVGLMDEEIAFGNSPPEIEKVCPAIEDLDLSKNLLSSWTQLCVIVKQLPQLSCLRLSKNRFVPVPKMTPLEGFNNLQKLVLHDVLISAGEICQLAKSMPLLSNLQLGYNDIGLLPVFPPSDFSNLIQLNLENNPISSWDNVVDALGDLPLLEKLDLSHTAIRNLAYRSKTFLKLNTLLLQGSKIEDLESVDALNLFPKLQEVRFKSCPAADRLAAGGNLLVNLTGRLDNAETINGSLVTPRDRAEAEKYYLTLIGREVAKIFPGRDRADSEVSSYILKNHRRAATVLEPKYSPIVLAAEAAVSGALKRHMLELRINLYEAADEFENIQRTLDLMKPSFCTVKLLPAALLVRSLKLVLSKSLPQKLKPQALSIYVQYKKGGGCLPLDDPLKDLASFGIDSDDSLHLFVNR